MILGHEVLAVVAGTGLIVLLGSDISTSGTGRGLELLRLPFDAQKLMKQGRVRSMDNINAMILVRHLAIPVIPGPRVVKLTRAEPQIW
jgi:hypothetical protein